MPDRDPLDVVCRRVAARSFLRDLRSAPPPISQCGNSRHPNGPWHRKPTGPHSWFERIRQRVRVWRWGCRCPKRRT